MNSEGVVKRQAAIRCALVLAAVYPACGFGGACQIEDSEKAQRAACADYERKEANLQSVPEVQRAGQACRKYIGTVLDALSLHCEYKNKSSQLLQQVSSANAQAGAGQSNTSQNNSAALYKELRDVNKAFAHSMQLKLNEIGYRLDDYRLQARLMIRAGVNNLSAEKNCETGGIAPRLQTPGYVLIALAQHALPEATEAFRTFAPELNQETQAAAKLASESDLHFQQASQRGSQAGQAQAPAPSRGGSLNLPDAGQAPAEIYSPGKVAYKIGSTIVIGFAVAKAGHAFGHAMADLAGGAHGAHLGFWGKVIVAEHEIPAEMALKGIFHKHLDWASILLIGLAVTAGPEAAALGAAFYYPLLREIQLSKAYQAHAVPKLRGNPALTAQDLNKSFCEAVKNGTATAPSSGHGAHH